MNQKFIKNIITGAGGQFIVIVLGIIIPRIMIGSYGSDIYGLLSTIGQIFTYLAILEAGIGQATRNALYKPISEKNDKNISEVISTSKSYFGKVTRYYFLAVVFLAFIAPIVINTNVDKITIAIIVMIEGCSGVLSFYYIETYSILLNSDGRGYINNILGLTNKIIGYIAKIVLAYLRVNIIILEIVFFLIVVAKVLFYKFYFKKRYKNLSFDSQPNYSILKDRNAFILTEISGIVFSSTDMIVLSVFLNTTMASVYAVYNMIFLNFNVLLDAVATSVSYILGTTYHENLKKYEKVHDSLTTLYLCMMTIFMSVSYIFTIPFVELYTKSVADVNYIYNSLPLMFCIVQLLSWSRNVSGNLTGIAGYAKQTSYISLIEAVSNVVLSIIFVNKFGIIGVLVATVIALPIKVLWCIYISDKKVMNRSMWKSLKILCVNYLFFAIIVLISRHCALKIDSYIDFVIYGVITTLVIGSACILMNLKINKDLFHVAKKYILKR